MAADHYEVLGVAKDAGPDEIKKAYRRLARELHPDAGGDEERFKAVGAAYEVLSDPRKRELYDLGGDPRGGGGAGAGFGFSDIMDAFFGGQAGGGGRGPRPRRRRGQDALIRVELDLSEAAFGANRDLTLDTAVVCATCAGEGTAPGTRTRTCEICRGAGETQQVQRSFLGNVMTSRPCAACQGFGTVIPTPCPECAGEGRVRQRRTLTVKIPAGVETGTRIQLAGESEVGVGAGPAGDLYVEVVERPHPQFQRRGDDLHCTVTLPMVTAALGTSVGLDTLDGHEDLEVKGGTQSGAVLPLRARGVPHLRGTGRGDLFVHVEVQTPTRLDDAQEDLLRQLARMRGEESVEGAFRPGQQGIFSRLRDAFGGR